MPEISDFCDNINECLEGFYFDNKNSCLYTGEPCPKFKSSVSLKAIRRIIKEAKRIPNITSEGISVSKDKIEILGTVGRSKFILVFDRNGRIKEKIFYDQIPGE